MKCRGSFLNVALGILCATDSFASTILTPPTEEAFHRYVTLTEAGIEQTLHTTNFLYIDTQPQLKAKVRAGDMVIERRTTLDNGRPIDVPDGRIHHWLGAMFLPGATLAQFRAVLQDYDHYKDIYGPEVIDSKLERHAGDDYDIFLRLYKKQIITVVFNTGYHVLYGNTDAQHMYLVSRSTRIAEVKNPKRSYTEELPPGRDTGFLWRLNAYWRLEESDGGVYAECQAVSLSRDIPTGLGWLIGNFVEKFPRESMINTLRATRRAVEALGTKD